MTRLLVTRPEPAASKTAAKLARKGYSATVLPLTRIVPLPVSEVLFAGPFDGVAATSANAVRHAPDGLLSVLRNLPAFAVGERTGQAFRRHGFIAVKTAGGDAETLAALVARYCQAGSRIAYLCGHMRTSAFEEQTGKSGMTLTPIEAYDAEIVPYQADFLRSILAEEPFDAVLLYSGRAAEAFAPLLDGGRAESALFAGARFLCLSEKIAGALPEKWRERATSSASPDESALFDLLARS
jgi:uroporphyrinogen-III synthase